MSGLIRTVTKMATGLPYLYHKTKKGLIVKYEKYRALSINKYRRSHNKIEKCKFKVLYFVYC